MTFKCSASLFFLLGLPTLHKMMKNLVRKECTFISHIKSSSIWPLTFWKKKENHYKNVSEIWLQVVKIMKHNDSLLLKSSNLNVKSYQIQHLLFTASFHNSLWPTHEYTKNGKILGQNQLIPVELPRFVDWFQ